MRTWAFPLDFGCGLGSPLIGSSAAPVGQSCWRMRSDARVSSSGGRLDGQTFEIGRWIFRIEHLAIEEGFLTARSGSGKIRNAEILGRRAPDILAVYLLHQRFHVRIRREFAPADVFRDEPAVMAAEGIGRMVLPELHLQTGIFERATVAVIDIALEASKNVLRRHVEPLALAEDGGHFLLVRHLIAPLLRLHHGHQQRLGGVGVLFHPIGAHAERLFRMALPELSGGTGSKADALIDELFIPRLAHTEDVHIADLHVGNHLRRRNDDGGDVLVRIDAASGEPVADPEIMGAAGEGHRGLNFLAFGLLLLESSLQFGSIELNAGFGIFLGDGNTLAVEVEAGEDGHRHRHIILGHLAGVHEIGHRRQNMRAINAVGCATKHEIVARRAPGGLLQNLDIRHAMLGEQPLFRRDDERGGIGQRDKADFRTFYFRLGGGCESTRWKGHAHSADKGCGGGRLQYRAAADSAGEYLFHSHVPLIGPPLRVTFSLAKKPENKKRRSVFAPAEREVFRAAKPCDVCVFESAYAAPCLPRSPLTGAQDEKQEACQFIETGS
ncbi:conserved hypothetical protein [Agrobacterium tumefaciens str. Kerr 14]|uniref:Uncharacterized protein n=1 Tax=Agrobacterium tumefaciens str. Kerr 14 TaxID=1183424 RepID=A0A1S7RZP5_AGRTU|nr:conserved hypothetical protein [Agrobacterium tumefaciens str. Kerr 14]